MRQNNGRLVALVASVAVAAVLVGGAFAYRQGVQAQDATAAPLPTQSGSTPAPSKTPIATPPPSVAPSKTPVTPPTSMPSSNTPPANTGPVTVTLNVSKLPKGRAPQVPYLVGREVRGGAGSPIKVPGSQGILAVGRMDPYVLAVVLKGDQDSELLKIDFDKTTRTPGISSLVTTSDQSAAAYAAARLSSRGTATKGATVYAESSGGGLKSVKLPNSWDVEVLAYTGGRVYFRGGDTAEAAKKLYRWTPGESSADVVKAVPSPTAISPNGELGASASLINDAGSCSAVVEVGSGRQRWRTCDNWIDGFTPDGNVAIGGPAYGDGFCDTEQAALNAEDGKLLRKWKGCFHAIAAEDDQHLLMVAVASGGGGDPGTKSSIIRCTINTGDCELATPITTDLDLAIGR